MFCVVLLRYVRYVQLNNRKICHCMLYWKSYHIKYEISRFIVFNIMFCNRIENISLIHMCVYIYIYICISSYDIIYIVHYYTMLWSVMSFMLVLKHIIPFLFEGMCTDLYTCKGMHAYTFMQHTAKHLNLPLKTLNIAGHCGITEQVR